MSRKYSSVTFVEHHPTGFGVGTATTRLPWRFLNTRQDCPLEWEQTAYQIQVLRSEDSPIETYEVTSDASVLVPWPSSPLQSRERVQLRVQTHGRSINKTQTEPTNWSLALQLSAPCCIVKTGKAFPLLVRKRHLMTLPYAQCDSANYSISRELILLDSLVYILPA